MPSHSFVSATNPPHWLTGFGGCLVQEGQVRNRGGWLTGEGGPEQLLEPAAIRSVQPMALTTRRINSPTSGQRVGQVRSESFPSTVLSSLFPDSLDSLPSIRQRPPEKESRE